ncbi:MAG: PVC-type heme-binding CxxCH protein [Phycisphaeraceae bacterium]
MKRTMHALCCLMLSLSMLPHAAHAEEGEWKSIFNGKDLTGWDGDKKFWSVEDGAITGTTTKENPTSGNTFIVWTDGETGDFELSLEYKIINGNSGIQYRSFNLKKDDPYRIGGYQADFEAGNTYSGILYGEAFRGILANRGQITVIEENGKPKVTGKVGESAEIQAKIKKEDWNTYKIVAKGFNFKHYINDVQTIECTDEDTDTRKATGLLALQLHAGPPMKVQFRNIKIKGNTKKKADAGSSSTTVASAGPLQAAVPVAVLAAEPAKKKIVFIAGGRSHGFGSHDHKAGCQLLADQLEKSGLPVECVVTYPGWPKDMSIFEGASAIVIFADGGGGHPMLRNLKDMKAMMDKGVGLGCIHYGVEVPRGSAGEAMLEWTGGYFETKWSVNPHWTIKEATINKEHPIGRGVKPFSVNDEWYFHMRFRQNMDGVAPILSAVPPAETITGRWKVGQEDGNHNGNQFAHESAVVKKQPQHLMWARQRPTEEGGGRGFGFTGSHYHWNWASDGHRTLVLNGIAWIAGLDVPKDGVPSKTPSAEEMLQNHDEDMPGNFDKAGLQKRIDAMNGRSSSTTAPTANPAGAASSATSNVKPAFASKTVTAADKGHAVDVEADITGAKELFLVASDAGDGFGCDWAAWMTPRLIDKDGKETKLTDLKWKSAGAGHGNVNLNKNSAGNALRVNGSDVEYGIGTHANSVIQYALPANHTFVKFKAKGGLDEGGTKQGCGSTVQFMVYTQAPPAAVVQGSGSSDGGTAAATRTPESAIAGLDVHEDLQVELFAAEPMLLSPSNIDIDHKGRIWVCEVVNYRRHNGKRPEGDRIIILEDSDGDGKADGETKVFYQGRDIDSAHGVTVLATPDGKGTHVIVSAGDKVQVFVDKDGDDKADDKYTLFSGISGAQHDHGIHQFMFGPDGKLYFNFGNSGNQIKDKDGKLIVDKAGNEVKAGRKPYQEGMIFRCNLDGSEFETLAWNFRNNWMVTVDSYGNLWQSDNDDDGNRGVRINFVVEFGNYGYKDEITGAGWGDAWKKANAKAKQPDDQKFRYHWHLDDPGVMPNLLDTGQGSPTGITITDSSMFKGDLAHCLIHCDAGPNVVRAYPAKLDGTRAGYTAHVVDVLVGKRDKWFRPSDVKVAPDGSLIVADWYDPGVGGHGMGDLDRGRLFRVTPKGHKGYKVPKYDFSSAAGAASALHSPTPSVRYIAFQALLKMGDEAEKWMNKTGGGDMPAHIRTQISTERTGNPRTWARAIWVMGKMPGKGQKYVDLAIKDAYPEIRMVGIRLARQLPEVNTIDVVKQLTNDRGAMVRREALVALRHSTDSQMPALWAELATKYTGDDRWMLETLGLSSDLRAEECFAAYLAKVPDPTKSEAGRDIVWRVRSKAALPLLVKIVQDKKLSDADRSRFMRAFDFHPKSAEKDAALLELLN